VKSVPITESEAKLPLVHSNQTTIYRRKILPVSLYSLYRWLRYLWRGIVGNVLSILSDK